MKVCRCEHKRTGLSPERTFGRLCPRYWGTAKLVPRPGRGAKKLFSKNEALTRTRSRSADREAVLKQRIAANSGAGVTEIVLSEKGFYEKNAFYRRKGSRWKRWCVEECVLQRWAFRCSGAKRAEAVLL